jgi:hypothetical protein
LEAATTALTHSFRKRAKVRERRVLKHAVSIEDGYCAWVRRRWVEAVPISICKKDLKGAIYIQKRLERGNQRTEA